MMGRSLAAHGALFYEFSLEEHVPANHLLRSIDRFVDLSEVRRHLAPFYSPVLQPDRATVGRSRADDPDAADRLLLRHPVGAAAVRGGSPQSRLPLVLPARPDRPGARPLDLLQEPTRPLPRVQPLPASLRDGGRTVHRRGAGRRRAVRRGRQPDPGGRQQAELDAAEGTGLRTRSIPAPRRGPCASIWPCSTMRPSAPRAT